MNNLFFKNTPQNFWLFAEEIPDAIWIRAIKQATPLLGITCETGEINEILQLVLGEGQFGSNHWRLSSLKRLYYFVKPFLPRSLFRTMRKFYQAITKSRFPLN